MNYSIKHLFHINASKEKIFEALTTIHGLSQWWTVQTSGDASINGELKFQFGEFGGPTMLVTEVEEGAKVSWRCIDEGNSWYGHEFTFLLDENDNKIRIRFNHSGWEEQNDFYSICCFSWGRYLESLRQYCQTGSGEAFGSEGYRK